jgi:crotonobetainyl-CoA:carnitine CoA-transferase CaiB-like acyl-CoA transferase
MQAKTSKQILEGIRVIDWTTMHAGPMGTMMLGDLGAEIIKIEDTIRGDIPRGVVRIVGLSVPVKDGRNMYFEVMNRNKKGITLDLNQEEGQQILYRFIEKADVFVHNRPIREVNKRKLDYETLCRINPKLVYFTMPGFGSKGPLKDSLSFDLSGQAMSGMMFEMGPPFMPPLYMQGGPIDQTAGMLEAYAIIAGLLARERFGIGQKIETSSLTAAIWLQAVNVQMQLFAGYSTPRVWRETEENPLWNYYECKDHKWIVLTSLQSDRFWEPLCNALGVPEMVSDPRFNSMNARRDNCQELIKILDRLFIKKTRDEWVDTLSEYRVMHAPILSMDETVSHPQVLANEDIIEWDHPAWGKTRYIAHPIKFYETPAQIKTPAPMWSEHTEMVLNELLGMSWDEISQLKEKKIIV